MSSPLPRLLVAATRRLLAARGPLLGLAAYRILAGVAIAYPLVAVLGRAVERHPSGDAVLFAPGAELLVEVLRVHGPALATALEISVRVALVLGLGALVPLGALLEAFHARRRPPWPALVARALARWPPLAAVTGVTMLGQAALFGLGLAAFGAFRELAEPLGELGSDGVGLLPVATATLGVVSLSIVADLVRVGVVVERGRLGPGLALGIAAAREGWRQCIAFYTATRFAALLLLAGMPPLLAALGPDRGAFAGVAVVVSIQLVVLGADSALRGLWLAAAFELVERVRPSPRSLADRAERSASPGDPSSTPGA